MDENNEKLPNDYTQAININAVTNEEMKNRRRAAANVEATNEEIVEKEENPKTAKQPKNNNKKKINIRLVCLIVILVCIVLITVCLVVLKIKNINKKYVYEEPIQSVFEQEEKEVDTSAQYVYKDGDTYNVNGLVITDYIYQNGREYLYPGDAQIDYDQFYSTYSLISGLKNKDVENKINTIIKQKSLDTNYIRTYASMSTGLGNIFSFSIGGFYRDGDQTTSKTIYATTFDLNTGNELTMNDIFAKSTPIISIFTDGYLQAKAWKEENVNAIAGMGGFHGDLNRVDTSEYEDTMFKVKKMYEANKDNLKFTVSPGAICVYGFDGGSDYSFKIPMYKNIEYVICYNKYKTADLYENSFALTNIPLYAWPGHEYANGEKDQAIYFENNNNYYIDIYIDPDQYKFQGSLNSSVVKPKVMALVDNIKNKYSGNGLLNINGDVQLYKEGIDGKYKWNNNNINHYKVTVSLNVARLKGNKPLSYYLAEANYTPWAGLCPAPLTAIVTNHTHSEDDIEYIENNEENYGGTFYYKMYFDENWNYLGDTEECVRKPMNYYNSNNGMQGS